MYHRNQTLHLISLRVLLTLVVSFVTFFASPLMAEEQKDDAPKFTRMVGDYKAPDVTVVRQDGKKLSFIKELDDGRPVMMNFIFASCSAICPMLSHVFSTVQTKLAEKNQKFHLISISIDPENDTPAKLTEYGKKFAAGADWDFYTGTMEASLAIQQAFDAYRGDKMNHSSLILMRAAPGKPWIRLDGFTSPDAVISEYHSMLQ